jgi:hypothetical protein
MKITFAKRGMLAAVGAAAITAPALLLFAGAGTAQADNVCTPYDEGYSNGVFGGSGQCFSDPSKQSQFDSGYNDGSAGRPSNPPPPFSIITPDPGQIPQSTMSPWDGQQGNGPYEAPEWPEYHEPQEPYEPSEQPWETPILD